MQRVCYGSSLFGAALAALVGGAAFTTAEAGGLAEAKPEAVVTAPAAAPVADWRGAYGGLSYASGTGTNTYYVAGGYDKGPLNLEGSVPGLFAGYNFQRGRLVYGGEISAHMGKIEGTPPGYDEQDYTGILDLKGRLGYAAGRFLIYGALGYSYSRLTEDYIDDETTLGGFGYGIGVDYQLGSRYFVGLEYYRRETNGDIDYAPFWSLEDSNVETVSLRLGLRF